MILTEGLPAGSFSRWAFGVIILTHLVAYNDCGSACVLVAALVAMFNALLTVECKNGLNQLQIPYLRASHRFDYFCIFIALWMEFLSLITVCAAIARTISFSLDAMSGGLVRIYILGRNSSISEPWPDVLGVVIVFIISAMFILGLENSRVFSVLLISSVLAFFGLIAIVTYLRGNIETWRHENLFPKGLTGVLSSSALLAFSFPHNSASSGRHQKLKSFFFASVVLVSIVLASGCLSTLFRYDHNKSHEYETMPILRILDAKDLHKLIPGIGCLYVIACSSALLEVYTEAFQIVASLASSEWKILLKQIAYESRESGNPILAIFVSGSLIAILAFACPLENMTYIIAGSYLFSGLLRAFYYLYSPFRPKTIINPKNESSQAYSRLDSTDNNNVKSKTSLPKRTSMWFKNKAPSISAANLTKSISKLNKSTGENGEMEKEWLLLGEPSSPINHADQENVNAESAILSDSTDTDCIMKAENSDSDSEEDIDSVVEEYQQKVKVSTAGLKEMNLKVPSIGSWRISLFCLFSIIVSATIAALSALWELLIPFSLSLAVIFVMSVILLWTPRYSYSHDTPAIFTCCGLILLNSVLLSTMKIDSWLALGFWFLSGCILVAQSLIKCDVWCCLCLEYPRQMSHTTVLIEETVPIPNGTIRYTTASIKLKNPPLGSSVINHVQQSRR